MVNIYLTNGQKEMILIYSIICNISFFIGKTSIGFSHGKRALLFDKTTTYKDSGHVVQSCLDLVKLLGIEYNTDKLIKLNVSDENKKFVDDLVPKRILIGMAPGTSTSAISRMWPKQRFAELSDKLIEKYKVKIIFVGGKSESSLINEIQNLMKNKSINLAGKTSLKQLFYLIEKCNIFISNDTGPMHIAAAQGVKTIGLFGPNLPVRFGPYGPNNIAIYKGALCSPCINVHKGQVPECSHKEYQECMKKIKVEDVLDAVKKLIEKAQPNTKQT